MRVSIIAAVAENGVIGRGGTLPWHLSSDLQRFKRLTMGHTIVMGRRTWESIGRPLTGRWMVVVSRKSAYHVDPEGVEIVHSLNEALNIADARADSEAFIIGGGELYREALPTAHRLYMTRVLADVAGDTFFPPVDWSELRLVESESHGADARNEHPFALETYERTTPNVWQNQQ
jgi:dihydrofolate reductase